LPAPARAAESSAPAEVEPAVVEPAVVEPAVVEIVPLAEMERRLILAALARCANDVPRAAALLEINPSTIYRKLQVWKGRAS
jgi:two-component system repressor protein LuxO